uniref:NADH-ubiquinone oxidoreductase chain 1 n=1 Tax=Eualetes tulipa TaxID=765164 RepID=E2FLT7_9CAEN|nr:NADH dehydrogenase subunit 1 [Eualetes tulipa]ADI79403.1 NADH dehydrogenase subunit 1 [Eualetes tulipa]
MLITSSCLFTYICILLAVAFYTLLERKGLSYIQKRKGPNKVGLAGLPQPLSDAAKLLTKEIVSPTMANLSVFMVAPVFSFLLALLLWQLYPSTYALGYMKCGVLFFLCVSAMNVYGTLLAGWSSNSKYALLGSLRAIAQTISYEVSMALILLFPIFLLSSFDFMSFKEGQEAVWFVFLFTPVACVWVVTCVAETNRAPFDFAEGESEIVSGFNIEYGSTGFALIFLAEYANILVMSLFSVVLFVGGGFLLFSCLDFLMVLELLAVSLIFIWARGSFPRFRYDLLMGLTWKTFLPIALSILVLLLVILYLC